MCDRFHDDCKDDDESSVSTTSSGAEEEEDRLALWCLKLLNHPLDWPSFSRLVRAIESLDHAFLTVAKSAFMIGFLRDLREAMFTVPVFANSAALRTELLCTAACSFEELAAFHQRHRCHPDFEPFYRWLADASLMIVAESERVQDEIDALSFDSESSSDEEEEVEDDVSSSSLEEDATVGAMPWTSAAWADEAPFPLPAFEPAQDVSRIHPVEMTVFGYGPIATAAGISFLAAIRRRFGLIVLFTCDESVASAYRAAFGEDVHVQHHASVAGLSRALGDFVQADTSARPATTTSPESAGNSKAMCVVLDVAFASAEERLQCGHAPLATLHHFGISLINVCHEVSARTTHHLSGWILMSSVLARAAMEQVYTKVLAHLPTTLSWVAFQDVCTRSTFRHASHALAFDLNNVANPKLFITALVVASKAN